MKFVQSLSDENLPNKLMYVASLHSCIGNAQLELGETEEALTHHLEDLKIAEEKLVKGGGKGKMVCVCVCVCVCACVPACFGLLQAVSRSSLSCTG